MSAKTHRISLNISGTYFEVSQNVLLKYPNSRLGKIASSSITDDKELYFDRPTTSFEYILTFYQTGKLHIPPNACPMAFKEELEFWEIDQSELQKCCMFAYNQFQKLYETKIKFQDQDGESKECDDTTCTSVKDRVWKIIDFHETTLVSKLFLSVGVAFVLLSVITIALGSLPQYRRDLTPCEMVEYMKTAVNTNKEFADFFMKRDCNTVSDYYKDSRNLYHFVYLAEEQQHQESFYDYFSNIDTAEADNTKHATNDSVNSTALTATNNSSQNAETTEKNLTQQSNSSNTKPPLKMSFPKMTFKQDIFYKIDYLTTVFFTLELILRLIVCPSLKKYYRGILNSIDSVILTGTYVDIIIVYLKPEYKYTPDLMNVIDFFKFLRVIRLLRFCQHLTAIRVLKFSLKQNANDLLILLVHIILIVLFFANVIYLSEERHNIDSIPQGWWLAIVTMTTVGFGDLVPKSVIGKVACSVCAFCSILTLALITPIFVDTFMSLYSFAQSKTFDKGKTKNKCRINP